MNSISWSKKARKQLLKLPQQDAVVIYDGVEELKQFPESRNVKRLTNHQYDYRLRVGRYRVLFDFDGEVKVVSIEEVKKRDGQTY
ncbi:cytotoxic translational repressor of toxin-antitoxin stability system [Zobellella endophytica]|uniref:Cytotoxic translational repressor of toxin-antitoxin stability system n=1 Tax=Zobellella endophytica TaxID=2116700 RepID=A0A2P7RC82_9GAMM|nr:cytotoxic translational repressor of toxin-antitoxin stability system [Zobellella endophytica]